ncbi:MAG TPA: helix-turn-helix domain-containing protein [Saprospiraceae bacterium]|nr:helix-turn-helix domain-containing protein [Saprospiraceae bacterium]HMQ84834.1 helix-turn-helix domain-containing protein [Saprospiraceae bacterium]
MQAHYSIEGLFIPNQPTLSGAEITYNEVAPDPVLRRFIYCYWQLKTRQALAEDFSYRVVADGCTDVLWEVGQADQHFVAGFSSEHTIFSLASEFHYFGIRFLPGAFTMLFQVPAVELRNRFEVLNAVLPAFSAELAAQTSEMSDFTQVQYALNVYFKHLALRQKTSDPDPRFWEALIQIVKAKGTLSIEKDLNTGISPRQLRRLFEQYIGSSPKTFSKVVRFQHVLQAIPSKEKLKTEKLYYDMGFYDQAHFIKEFRHLYGLTPGEALQ